jgi:hypothetical protein
VIVIAHVGGVPVEEMLPMVSAIGTGVALAITWIVSHVRGPRSPRHDRASDAGGSGGTGMSA